MYMTSAVHGIGSGEKLKYRYVDLLKGEVPEEDNRSGDEIAADVINSIGLKVTV